METNSIKKYENGFTTVDNGVLRKLKLSVKSIGIWVKLLSLPNNWKFSKVGLQSIMGIGKESLNNSLLELEKNGLFCIEKIYPTKEKPLMSYRYCVFSRPNTEEIKKLTKRKKEEANQGTGFQALDNQEVENQPLDNLPPYKESTNKLSMYKKCITKEESQAKDLAFFLLKKSRELDNKFRLGKDKETITSWSTDIEKLIRIDKRDYQEIADVINWCKTDGCFWAPNIQSGRKLREKFSTLFLQMKEKPAGKQEIKRYELDINKYTDSARGRE